MTSAQADERKRTGRRESGSEHPCLEVNPVKSRMVMEYVRMGRIPKAVPAGRVLVHNHLRPPGFPNIAPGFMASGHG